MLRRCAMPVMPAERVGGNSWLRGALDATRKESRVGDEYQAVLPRPSAASIQPFPAPPPQCACALPAVWWRKRWWCSVDEPSGCEFEVVPPPFARTPVCDCGRPAKWEARGEEWTCLRAGASGGKGCGFTWQGPLAPQDTDSPRPASPTRLDQRTLEKEHAVRTAEILTAAAYSDEAPLPMLDDDVNMEECCLVCGDGENNVELLLLCDGAGCSAAVHTFCLDPPLARVPDDEWYCADCVVKRAASTPVGGSLMASE